MRISQPLPRDRLYRLSRGKWCVHNAGVQCWSSDEFSASQQKVSTCRASVQASADGSARRSSYCVVGDSASPAGTLLSQQSDAPFSLDHSVMELLICPLHYSYAFIGSYAEVASSCAFFTSSPCLPKSADATVHTTRNRRLWSSEYCQRTLLFCATIRVILETTQRGMTVQNMKMLAITA